MSEKSNCVCVHLTPDQIDRRNLLITENSYLAQNCANSPLDVIRINYCEKKQKVVIEYLKSSEKVANANKNPLCEEITQSIKKKTESCLICDSRGIKIEKPAMENRYNNEAPVKDHYIQYENMKTRKSDNFVVSDFKFPGPTFVTGNKPNYCELFFDGTLTRRRRKSTHPVRHKNVQIIKPTKSDSNINMRSNAPLDINIDKNDVSARKRVYRMKDTLVDRFKHKFRSVSPTEHLVKPSEVYKSSSSNNEGELYDIELNRNEVCDYSKARHRKHKHEKIVLTASALKMLNKIRVRNVSAQTELSLKDMLIQNISPSNAVKSDIPKYNTTGDNYLKTVSNFIFSSADTNYPDFDMMNVPSNYIKPKKLKRVNLKMTFNQPVIIKHSDHSAENYYPDYPKRPQMPRRFIGSHNLTDKSYESCCSVSESDKDLEAFEDKDLKMRISEWLELVREIDVDKMNKNHRYYKSVCGLIKNCNGFVQKMSSNFIPDLKKRCGESTSHITVQDEIHVNKKNSVKQMRSIEKVQDYQSSKTIITNKKPLKDMSDTNKQNKSVKFRSNRKPRSKSVTPEKELKTSNIISKKDVKTENKLPYAEKILDIVKQFSQPSSTTINNETSKQTCSKNNLSSVDEPITTDSSALDASNQIVVELLKLVFQQNDDTKDLSKKQKSHIPKREIKSEQQIENKIRVISNNKPLTKYNSNVTNICSAPEKNKTKHLRKSNLSITTNNPIVIQKLPKKLSSVSSTFEIKPDDKIVIQDKKICHNLNDTNKETDGVNKNLDDYVKEKDVNKFINEYFQGNYLEDDCNNHIDEKSTTTNLKSSKIPIHQHKHTNNTVSTMSQCDIQCNPNKNTENLSSIIKFQQPSRGRTKLVHHIPVRRIIERRTKLSNKTKKFIVDNYTIDKCFESNSSEKSFIQYNSKHDLNSNKIDFDKSCVSQKNHLILNRTKISLSQKELKTPLESVDSRSTITIVSKSDVPSQSTHKKHNKIPGLLSNSSALFTKTEANSNKVSSFQRRKEYYKHVKDRMLNRPSNDNAVSEWRKSQNSAMETRKLKEKSEQINRKVIPVNDNIPNIRDKNVFTSIDLLRRNRDHSKYVGLDTLSNVSDNCQYLSPFDPFMRLFNSFKTNNLFITYNSEKNITQLINTRTTDSKVELNEHLSNIDINKNPSSIIKEITDENRNTPVKSKENINTIKSAEKNINLLYSYEEQDTENCNSESIYKPTDYSSFFSPVDDKDQFKRNKSKHRVTISEPMECYKNDIINSDPNNAAVKKQVAILKSTSKVHAKTDLEIQTSAYISNILKELITYISNDNPVNKTKSSSLLNIDSFCKLNESNLNSLLERLKNEDKFENKSSHSSSLEENTVISSEPFVKLINKIYETNKFFCEHFPRIENNNTVDLTNALQETTLTNTTKYIVENNNSSSSFKVTEELKPRHSTLNKMLNKVKKKENSLNRNKAANKNVNIENFTCEIQNSVREDTHQSYSSSTVNNELSRPHVTYFESSTTLSEMKYQNDSDRSSCASETLRKKSSYLSSKLSQMFSKKTKRKN